MQPTLREWEAESLARPRFNLLRCYLWDGPLSRRVASWEETLGERYGERAQVVLDAFAYVKELQDKWIRGVAWHDRNPEHPAWDDNWEKTAQRALEFGAAADELADYLECSVSELGEVLEYASKVD